MTHTSTHQSEALIFANDRPTSLDDDLYQWSIDAEDLIREQHDRIAELEAQLAAAQQGVHRAEVVPASVIAGAIYDFADYLSTLPYRVAIYSNGVYEPALMAGAIAGWCKRRNLTTGDAKVENWQDHLAPIPAAQSVDATLAAQAKHGGV